MHAKYLACRGICIKIIIVNKLISFKKLYIRWEGLMIWLPSHLALGEYSYLSHTHAYL